MSPAFALDRKKERVASAVPITIARALSGPNGGPCTKTELTNPTMSTVTPVRLNHQGCDACFDEEVSILGGSLIANAIPDRGEYLCVPLAVPHKVNASPTSMDCPIGGGWDRSKRPHTEARFGNELA